MATYRTEFVEALKLLAGAFAEIMRAGHKRPVIVGGAAVEFYTGGSIVSGDFDVVTDATRELEEALIARGFRRPSGAGALLRGVFHPSLGIGVEVVSGELFDGAADEARVRLVTLDTEGEPVAVPAVEDMIADRMGQFCANPAAHGEMLTQAIVLYRIAKLDVETPLDEDYLDQRIGYETAGTYSLRFLSEKADEAHDS
ncbi:MAG TPA: hypothetical protein VN754_07540 [Candidatus Binataceae bacterium]|nr:hypothetical protein [Stellaceae bacterium]HXR35783.1 hypothetical protein [Candidatus Binataceae bacterium]